ncbi:amidohydrolase [Thalassoporum mexicanum PCC 7367]|uniref:cytosine deaminase n=1 Tax=Thalassoporum mexicanum TaxID=3457544 RepID=UPI00029FB65D|nr:cytosine deaminase [Pseudanabaena sp. PCC 7367]AFY68406.1 amidohydrolase [Pseudanabaena sp. PCC 7367]
MIEIPARSHYWLTNARVPTSLLASWGEFSDQSDRSDRSDRNYQDYQSDQSNQYAHTLPGNFEITREGLAAVDLEIKDGKITSIKPAVVHQGHNRGNRSNSHDNDGVVVEEKRSANQPTAINLNPTIINLNQGMVLPCFVDIHTHLDKGHIWNRQPNLSNDFNGAIAACTQDRQTWSLADLEQRMEFGIQCSYAHGTSAIRTHLDCLEPQMSMSLQAFVNLRDRWAGRVELQAVSLPMPQEYLGKKGDQIAMAMASVNGLLGGVFLPQPDLDIYLDRIFTLAQKYDLNLDFHVDETGDPKSVCLSHIARAAIRHDFQGKIVCGHCCSLAVQEPEQVKTTIELVHKAGIAIVSLPVCNLYLQNRQPDRTPTWRGVTLLRELKAAQVPVALASDNCRDPFLAIGDHDCLETFKLSALIAHLDQPYGDWLPAVTRTAADLIDLPQAGRLGVGLAADLVLFNARNYSELLSRPQVDRQVIRNGMAIAPELPAYRTLDHLVGS